MDVIGWEKIIALPAALLVLFLILWFALRALPTWKEVKLAEIRVRESEANSRTHEASMFGKLSEALNLVSGVIKTIAVDQHRDTKNIELLQRVNADASDKILHRLDSLDGMLEGIEKNRSRVDALEERWGMIEELLISKEKLANATEPEKL